MTARVDQGDLHQVARAAGKSGKPLPSWASAEPRLRAAYFDGAGTPDPEATETPKTQPQRNPTKTAGGSRSSAHAARPSGARTRKAGAATRGSSWGKRSRVESGARGAAGQLRAHPFTLGSGSAGGLMLAVFVYPIVKNLLQGGPPYAVAWLKAKFLNDVGTTAGAPPPPNFYNNGNVGPGDAQS